MKWLTCSKIFSDVFKVLNLCRNHVHYLKFFILNLIFQKSQLKGRDHWDNIIYWDIFLTSNTNVEYQCISET